MCLFGEQILNRKYLANKKNRGQAPPLLDTRVKYVTKTCGNCIECRKKKAREWQVRLLEDLKHHKNGKMVTLTFSNESIKELTEYEKTWRQHGSKATYKCKINKLQGYELDNEIATVAIRLFTERWRRKFKKTLRHWLVTELGHENTENIHLHGIIWTDEPMETVEQIWKYGFIWKGYKKENGTYENYVNEKTVNYIIKYISKVDQDHKTYKSLTLTSKGMGKEYITTHNATTNRYKGNDTKETYITRTGHSIIIPPYWRKKIYNEEQREQLWIKKIEENVTYIVGQKLTNNNPEAIQRMITHWREKNRRLGYGDDQKDMNRQHYERERRIALTKYRIQNASGGV